MIVASPISLNALVGHLERLDATAVMAMAEQAVDGGMTMAEVIESLLLPAWRVLDDRGRHGELDPATVATAATLARRALGHAAEMAAGTAGGVVAPSDRPAVMVVGSSTSADLLGADVVSELVRGAGWPVELITGGAPADAVAGRIGDTRPAAVVVTFARTTDLAAAARIIVAGHREHVPVMAWGPAWGPDPSRAERLGADGWASSLEVVTSTLADWYEVVPPLATAALPPPGYGELERERAALLCATARISGADAGANDWAQRTAHDLIAHLAAAVLVCDSRILTEHLIAVRRGLTRRKEVRDVHLLGLVEALAGALTESTQPARSYVLTCRDDLRRALVSSEAQPAGSDADSLHVPVRPVSAKARAAVADGARDAGGPNSNNGQVFADILLLAALSCQTPFALISVPQGDGQWSTLSYGFDQRDGLSDPVFFNLVASRDEPIEIADLSTFPGLAGCALAAPPQSLRWIYAAPIRNSSGVVLGVVAVLDRWLRQVSRREQRAMLAVTRQMVAHLSQLRKIAPAPAAPAAGPGWTPPARTDPRLRADAGQGVVNLRRTPSLPEGQQLLRSHEVAVLFDVTERTVINWAAAGKLASLRTIGGHLRFRSDDVLELLAGRTSGHRPAATP